MTNQTFTSDFWFKFSKVIKNTLFLPKGLTDRVDLRTFAASNLRKNLSTFSEKSFSNKWDLITPET